MYGIMGLKKGGKGRHGAHAEWKGPSSYKTGSRSGTAAGDKGNKKSQANTARELNKMIKSGDLDRLVTRGHQDQGYRSGFSSPSTVIGGMTQKQQDFIARNRRKDGSLNSAAQSVLDFYSDDRSDYQRDLDKFIKSSPGAREAYLDRFPIGGALNLGIPAAFNALAPAPLKMLGSMVGDIGTAGLKALGHVVPEQIRKDITPGLQKVWGDVKDARGNLLRDAKGMLTGKLSPVETANLGIIKNEQQNERENLLEGPDTTDDIVSSLAQEILFGTDEGAATETVDASQNIAYDPRRSIGFLPRTDTDVQPPDILDELDDLITERSSETISTDLDDLLAESREKYKPALDWMPNEMFSPYTNVDATEHGPQYQTEDWLGTVQPKLDAIKKQQQEERLKELFAIEDAKSFIDSQYGKPAGQFDFSAQDDLFDVGGNQNQIDEIREQIEAGVYPGAPRIDWGFDQGGYLKKYDDGGYANMSTFEKLKAINDSIAEG